MKQVKIFKSVDTELAELEREINDWMRDSGVTIVSITGNLASQGNGGSGPLNSFAASDVLVVVLYETDEAAK